MVISKELATALDLLRDAFNDAQEYFSQTPAAIGESVEVSESDTVIWDMEVNEDGELVLVATQKEPSDDPHLDLDTKLVLDSPVGVKVMCAAVLPDLIAQIKNKDSGFPDHITRLAKAIQEAL